MAAQLPEGCLNLHEKNVKAFEAYELPSDQEKLPGFL